MANSNFVVHNGLSVGPLSIDAATGSISTTGTVSGGGNISVPTGSSLLVGTPVSAHANAPLDVTVSANSYAQINIQNISSVGTNASADFVATAPNGTDTSNYIDMGINGNLFVSPGSAWTISGALDGYVYVNGGHLTVGTDTAAKDLIFHTGGLTADKIKARFYDTAANLTVFTPLTVNGNVTVTSAYVIPSANAASSLGTSASRWNYIYGVNGNFLSVNANYADLAEKYVADAAYAPGTVLMFGGDKEVTECAHDMCSRVAGVVSTNPAYLMNSGLEGEHTVELALTGRVPTKVRGPIQKGDLIVSAGDGHARAEGLPQVGTVIGKALEDFNGDTGVIEVVVGKH